MTDSTLKPKYQVGSKVYANGEPAIVISSYLAESTLNQYLANARVDVKDGSALSIRTYISDHNHSNPLLKFEPEYRYYLMLIRYTSIAKLGERWLKDRY